MQLTLRQLALALAAGIAAQVSSQAGTISGISIANNSSASFTNSQAARFREFRTEATVPTSATTTGNTATFDTRFAWMLAHRVNPGGGTVALLQSSLVAYDILFTVEDPLNQGYSLNFDSVFRGYATTAWESNSGTGVSQVFSAGTLMTAQLDSGSGFGTVLGLSTTTGVSSASPTNRVVNLLVSNTGNLNAGTFVGTRSFAMRFSSAGSNTIGALQNFNTGEADVRFGLNPTLGDFLYATYPGLDGEDASSQGHFVTVSVAFNGGESEVPEPGTMGLLLGGALLIGVNRVRRAGDSRG